MSKIVLQLMHVLKILLLESDIHVVCFLVVTGVPG